MLFATSAIAGNAALGDLATVTVPLINEIQVLVGGIFGLYVILTIFRVYYEHKRVKLLRAILYNLDQRNIHDGLSYSRQRLGFFRRSYRKVVSWYHKKFVKLKHPHKPKQ